MGNENQDQHLKPSAPFACKRCGVEVWWDTSKRTGRRYLATRKSVGGCGDGGARWSKTIKVPHICDGSAPVVTRTAVDVRRRTIPAGQEMTLPQYRMIRSCVYTINDLGCDGSRWSFGHGSDGVWCLGRAMEAVFAKHGLCWGSTDTGDSDVPLAAMWAFAGVMSGLHSYNMAMRYLTKREASDIITILKPEVEEAKRLRVIVVQQNQAESEARHQAACAERDARIAAGLPPERGLTRAELLLQQQEEAS